MATKHVVHYRIAGGRSVRRNVITKSPGTLSACRDEIASILAAEHKVEPRQVQILDQPPVPEKPKPRASDIRKLNKSQLLDLVQSDRRGGTAKWVGSAGIVLAVTTESWTMLTAAREKTSACLRSTG